MIESKNQFRFRRNDAIGAADAESDSEFLVDCFVDTGDLQTIRDCLSPKRLIVGRTGVGKSALLRELSRVEDHVIELAPEVLALNYLTNSTILKFFEGLGVQLDPFYSLLWRHIFTVELIRHKFNIRNEERKSEFISLLTSIFQRDRAKEKALRYLEEWGSHFWEETEYRIREFTTKLESDLSAAVSTAGLGPELSVSGAEKLTEEQRQDVIQRAQHVVSGVQIKDLHEIMKLLQEDIFDDPQERFYLVIDRLDENWADEQIRYKLLRALLEAVRSFQQIQCVKIVLTLRSDLLDRVFRNTRDAGFQEEKYESLALRLRWSKADLETLLDKRMSKLIRRQYTSGPVKVKDILPNTRKSVTAVDYVLDRTFFRPREAILFLNECLSRAEGKAQITWQNIQSAEVEYSRKRLRSLADEWHAEFPQLPYYTKILAKRRTPFYFRTLERKDIDNFVSALFEEQLDLDDPITKAVQQYMDSAMTWEVLLDYLIRILYQVGVIGVKPDTITSVQWSHLNQPTLSAAQLGADVHLYVHPTFWMVLGTVRD